MSGFVHRFNKYVIQSNLANRKIFPKYAIQIDATVQMEKLEPLCGPQFFIAVCRTQMAT